MQSSPGGLPGGGGTTARLRDRVGLALSSPPLQPGAEEGNYCPRGWSGSGCGDGADQLFASRHPSGGSAQPRLGFN